MSRTKLDRPRGERPQPVRQAALLILDDIESLSERAVETTLANIPSYREQREELARSVRQTMRSFLDYAATGVPPSEADRARLRDVGRRRAEGRIPLADVLHAFRVSARVILRGFSEGGGHGPGYGLDRDGVLWIAEALFAYIDDVSTLVTARYAETQVDLLRAEDLRRSEFLSDLLHGHRTGAEAVAEAAALGVELRGESRVLVVGVEGAGSSATGGDGDLPDRAEATIDDLYAPTPVLMVRIGGDLVVLPLGAADPAALVDRLGAATVLVGEGRVHAGVEGIRASYAEARDALAIARATGIGPVARFSDLVLDRLLSQDPALLAELVNQTVGPLADYDRRRNTELVRTLEVWAAEGTSPTAAADRLGVHPHTISYRLGRIEELSGLTLINPDDRIRLLLGLRAARLLNAWPSPS